MNEDAFWECFSTLYTKLDLAYAKASEGKDALSLSEFERRVTDVSRLLANRSISAFANTAEQLANHEQRLRRIEQQLEGNE